MILFEILFTVIITYLFIYCVYQLFLLIKARHIENYALQQEKARRVVLNNRRLCVVIYATNKDKNLDKLLETLNNQTYNKKNYDVHVVFKKEENDTSYSRDFALGARIYNVQNPDYFSKNKAINLFLQKITKEEKYDVYVFLGVNRVIGERYLDNINKSIIESGVYVGAKISINDRNQLAKKIKHSILCAYLKYVNTTYNLVRSMFDLPFFIDGENLVVTADVLDKMGYIVLEDKDDELEYSLDLASNGIKSIFSPYIITGVNVKNYDFSSPGIRNKISLFSHYFQFLFMRDITFKEFILFALRPDSLIVILMYIGLFLLSIYFPNPFVSIVTALLGAFLCINFIISLYISRLNIFEIFWLCLYPLCLSWQKIKIFINYLSMQSIRDSKYEEENISSATLDAVINNGKRDINCKLDLVSEDGMKKVIFREGGKFITSDLYIRMYDALADMIYKLKTKGSTLKVCQNCEHFTISPDGTLDSIVGKCKISGQEICTWRGCQYFYKHSENEE